MTSPLLVGLALSARPWRGALQRHCRDHVADVSIALVRDGLDANDSGLDVVVLDDDTSWLSIPLLTQLRESGIVVVGLYDPLEADGHGERHLQRLGVDAVLPCSLAVEDLLDALRSMAPDREAEERFAELAEAEGSRVPRSARQVLAVGGPAGAGATEVAVGLAQLWGGIRPLLIDVDETHPSIARRLGLGIHPHIVTAIEALRGERVAIDGRAARTIEECLAHPAIGGVALPFDVICGLASRDDWSLLRADDVGGLIEELAARWPVVVAKLGPNLEDLSRYVGRYEVSRTVVRRATRVIGVCEGSPVGVLRFVDWLVDAVAIAGETPIDVIVNRVPSSPTARVQIDESLREIAGDRIGDIAFAPRDKRVERAAWDAGLVHRGSFIKAIAALPLESTVPLAVRRDETSPIDDASADLGAGPDEVAA